MQIDSVDILAMKSNPHKHVNRADDGASKTTDGSSMPQTVLDIEHTSSQTLTQNYLKAFAFACVALMFTALQSTNPAQASSVTIERVDFSRAMPEERVEDMRVKVLGGTISVDRFYRVMRRGRVQEGYPGVSGDVQGDKGNTIPTRTGAFGTTVVNKTHYIPVWQFHRKWHDLLFNRPQLPVGASVGGDPDALLPPQVIDRNDYLYQRVPNKNYYVYEHNGNDLRITITDYGFRWSNREGDWIDYDQDGLAVRSGDKNGVTITIIRDGSPVEFAGTVIGGLITEYRDHLNRTILKWEYQDRKPVKVTDYTGRSVQYTWNEHELVEVTTTRGHKWRYQYESFGENRFLTAKTDPEDQKFTYSYAESKGGFQKVTPPRVNFSGVTIVGDNSAAAAGLGLSSSDFDLDVTRSIHSIAVQRTWMHTGMVYPDGKRVTYEYQYDPNSRSYMIFSKNSDGVESERWYDLDGQLRYNFISGRVADVRVRSGSTAVSRDAYGNSTIVKYNRFEAVESVSYPDGGSVSLKYLPNYNFPTLRTDELGVQNKHEYDFKGNRIKSIFGFNSDEPRIEEYEYDAFGQLTKVRSIGDSNTPTGEVEYKYDNYGNVTEFKDARGNVSQFKDYNAVGQYQTLIDARGKTWKMTYDDFGNTLTGISPLGFVTQFEYDSLHRLIKQIDAENRTQEFEYDSRNNQILSTDNAGGEVKYTRRMDGGIKTVKDEIGRTTVYSYDRVGRLTDITDAVGNSTSIDYLKQDEVAGFRQQRITSPNISQTIKFDPMFRISEVTQLSNKDDDLVTTYKTSYNLRGERISVTDPNGNSIRWSYNSFGQQQTVTNAENEVITNAYDARGNLKSVTNALDQVHRFEYDANANLIREYRPLGEVQTYGYDANDDVISLADYNGNSRVYTYDNDSRMTRLTNRKFGSTAAERIVNYTLDKTGLPKSVDDENCTVIYSYDALARLVEQTTAFHTGGLPIIKTLKNGYYANSELRSRTDAEGIDTVFLYDAAGKFKQLTIAGAGAISVSAYEGDLPKAMNYPGGLTREYNYDGLARLSNLLVADNAGNTKLNFAYQYDLAGNVTQRTTQQGTYKYNYDKAYRLISAEQPSVFGNQTYSYNENSSRTQLENNQGISSYGYNGNNELTSIQNVLDSVSRIVTKAYDANGALTSETTDNAEATGNAETTANSYNSYGRLTKVEKNDVELATYKYDSQGRRISKTVNGETTYFLYDDTGVGLVGEYDSSGTLIRGYSYNVTGQFSTSPVTHKVPKDGGGYEFDFYQNDHLGTPQLLVAANGMTTWQAEYDAFGNAEILTSDKVNPLRFPGQYFDQESGLYYNWNRYYDPSIGRYITTDPVGLDDGPNTYAYVAGNPINYYDPDGLSRRNRNGQSKGQQFRNRLWRHLVQQIQRIDPAFRPPHTARRPGSGVSRREIRELQQTLQNTQSAGFCGPGASQLPNFITNGSVSFENLQQIVPSGTPNLFTPSPGLPSGFRYQWNNNGVRFKVWGHGANRNAPAGSFSQGNPTATMRVNNRTVTSDGTTVRNASSQQNAPRVHIPLVD